MGHKPLIDQTGYDLQGGRVMVGGTGYDIIKGRTLIGGTGYDIEFGQHYGLADFVQMISESTLVKCGGRYYGSPATVEAMLREKQAGDYIFSFCDKNFSINRWDGSALQLIYQSSTNEGNVLYDASRNTFYYSDDGSDKTTVYSAALVLLRVSGSYTQAEADAIMSSIRLADAAGSNDGELGYISLPCEADSTLIGVFALSNDANIGFYSPANTAILKRSSSGSIYYDGSTAWLSNRGSPQYQYDGSIIKLASA